MKIADDGGKGLIIAAELQEFIHKLSSELAKDERLAERDARAAELEQGLEAAKDMHDKADAVRTGAFVGGALTMAGAAVQFGGIDKVGSAAKPISSQGEGMLQAGRTTADLGGQVSQLFSAAGADAEGRSLSAQTR